MEEKDFRNIIMMIQNKLDNLFICINDKQVVLDIDAAKLFGVGIDDDSAVSVPRVAV